MDPFTFQSSPETMPVKFGRDNMGEPLFSREASLVMFVSLIFTYVLSIIALYHIHRTMRLEADEKRRDTPAYRRLAFARIILGVAALLQACFIGISIMDLYV